MVLITIFFHCYDYCCFGYVFQGTPVVRFFPFCFWGSLFKLTIRKKGTLIIKGLMGNLVFDSCNFTIMIILSVRVPEGGEQGRPRRPEAVLQEVGWGGPWRN